MRTILFTLLTAALFTACGVTRYPTPTLPGYNMESQTGEPITQSLFTDRDATISEENIQKILNGTYEMPQQLRVAVIKFDGRRSYYGNEEDYLKNQQSYIDTLVEGSKRSGRIQKFPSFQI